MIYGLFIIFLFLALGNIFSSLTGHLIPGSVTGMLLLFGALLAGWVNPQKMRHTAHTITGNMALFFIPVGVGLMDAIDVIKSNWGTIITASMASTVLVIITVGWIQQKMEKWKK
jgi:holin-like protein